MKSPSDLIREVFQTWMQERGLVFNAREQLETAFGANVHSRDLLDLQKRLVILIDPSVVKGDQVVS